MENLSTNEPYVFLGQGPGVRGHKPREREHVQPPTARCLGPGDSLVIITLRGSHINQPPLYSNKECPSSRSPSCKCPSLPCLSHTLAKPALSGCKSSLPLGNYWKQIPCFVSWAWNAPLDLPCACYTINLLLEELSVPVSLCLSLLHLFLLNLTTRALLTKNHVPQNSIFRLPQLEIMDFPPPLADKSSHYSGVLSVF